MKPPLFVRSRQVRLSDCDPAGIMFYPQYFVIFNGLVEDWFIERLGIGYEQTIIRRRIGLPTVRMEVDFKAISRMGDEIDLSLDVERLGARSLTLQLRCIGRRDDIVRMAARQVLVTISLDTYTAVEIPPDIREAIARTAGIIQ